MSRCKECGFDKEKAQRERIKLVNQIRSKLGDLLDYELGELLKQEDYLTNEHG